MFVCLFVKLGLPPHMAHILNQLDLGSASVDHSHQLYVAKFFFDANYKAKYAMSNRQLVQFHVQPCYKSRLKAEIETEISNA